MENIIYLDTHLVVWLYAGNIDLLSERVKKEIEINNLLISPIVKLELQYLLETDRISVAESDITNSLAKGIGLKICNHQLIKVIEKSLSMTGIGGDEYDVDAEIDKLEELLKINQKNLEDLIIISHIPPHSICDLTNDGHNVGSKSYFNLILKIKPRLVLFGHIHENWGKDECIEDTSFLNVGPNGIYIEYINGSFIIEKLEMN